jgi:dinuclear metal center YbgI/SA1388 family protein
MKIEEVVRTLERFAPLPLQDGFDNAGLQIGLTDVETTGVLLCLDVTETILTEAIQLGCNLIVSHHPLLFKGYASLTGKDYTERCIIKAIKNDIVIYSAHTNLDNATGGVNFKIAEKIGLNHVQILDPKENTLLKLVTYVPSTYANKVRNALFTAGCGNTGNYDSCSYSSGGKGTFRAKEGAKPFCGSIGKLSGQEEIKIETVLPVYKKTEAVNALIEAHPYEEPVYDLYPILNTWAQAGAGVIGDLEEPESELDFLKRIKKIFDAGCLKHNEFSGRFIRKVALGGGAGAFLLPQVFHSKADVFITGEMKYHDYFKCETNILIAEIGHYESEQYTSDIFRFVITEMFPHVNIHISKVNTNPIKYL